MGGAGLSEAHRGHSRKAAAKALQELAPLRKRPPPESSFTHLYTLRIFGVQHSECYPAQQFDQLELSTFELGQCG